MRILITGVAGHIGSVFARWLQEHVDCTICGVDNLSCGYKENVPPGVRLTIADLADSPELPPADYVFHFAAMAAECLSPFVRGYHARNNLVGWSHLLNHVLATGCQRLVLASSIGVYGRGEAPFSEDSPCVPIDPYGAGKLFCEQDMRIAGEQHGLPWSVVRPHNVYGPGQSIWQKHRNVLGIWMRAALEGRPLSIFGDGQQRRSFSYADDILPCLWQAAVAPEAAGQIVNIGGAKPTAILDAAKLVAEITGGRIDRLEARHEVKEAWCTVEKSERLLGYKERTDLSEGVAAMWEWAKRQKPREIPQIEIELERGLPATWLPSRGS